MELDRRRVLRVAFGGVAEIFYAESSKPIVAAATKLSRFGCFIKTVVSLPEGSSLTALKITYDGQEFTAPVDVIHAEPGSGMGIRFGAISPKDQIILDAWLAKATPEALPRPDTMLSE